MTFIRVASELNEPVIWKRISPRGAGSRERSSGGCARRRCNIVNNAGIPMRRSPEALSEEDLVFDQCSFFTDAEY